MTGRRLYDALTDGWAEQQPWARQRGRLLRDDPVAWAFLDAGERGALNAAARKLSPKRKAKT